MASATMTDPPSVVIDANVAIAICVKEPDKFVNAVAKVGEESATEVVTFDNGVKAQATASNSPVAVTVIPTILIQPSP